MDKPEEYIFSSIPRTKRESVARDAEARVTQTVKSALQSYLERYFAPKGNLRQQLRLTAGFSVQFETRISGAKDKDDPTVIEVQLSRYWRDLKQMLPCIILVDSGFEYVMPGLGGLTGSWPIDRSTSSVELAMLANIPMELHIAAQDETTCADLRDLLVYILGPLTHFNKSHTVRSNRPEDKWEVRLPLSFQPSGLEHRNMEGDQKDIMWSTSISLDMTFEGLIRLGFDKQVQPELHQINAWYEGTDPIRFSLDTGDVVPLSTSYPSIESIRVPSEIQLNQHAVIDAPWVPAKSRFVIDNPRVARLDGCKLIPKRPGVFNLHLMDYTPGIVSGPKVIKTWSIRVKIV